MSTPQNILIIGATSSIARSSAMEFAARGCNLFLLSRDMEELQRIAQDLMIRYSIQVDYAIFDMEAIDDHQNIWLGILNKMKTIDGVLLASGYLGTGTNSLADQQKIITINFTGAVSILNHCAEYLAAQKKGFIIVIGSVAGERGRGSNYAYGSAKGALALYLQGLRNHLHKSNVHVLTVKPGFVDTAMIYGRPGVFLAANPQVVGKQIVKALDQKKEVVYLPKFWRYIMLVVKIIPEKIFKRLKI